MVSGRASEIGQVGGKIPIKERCPATNEMARGGARTSLRPLALAFGGNNLVSGVVSVHYTKEYAFDQPTGVEDDGRRQAA